MKYTIENGKTLLIDGPASVFLVSGKAETFGYTVKSGKRIVVREGKRLPFTIKKEAELEILLGENSKIEKVNGSTIPSSWIQAFKYLLESHEKPFLSMLMGSVDSGKTGFCTFLANKLVANGKKVAILDGDLGQSDIGPPGSVSYAFIKDPVADLSNLKGENVNFIGSTSPNGVCNTLIEGLNSLKREIVSHNPDHVLVNTDGWIDGEDAISYKLRLVKNYAPDTVFLIEKKHELTFLSKTLRKYRQSIVESPSVIKHRSKEERRSLRELRYTKYLKKSKVRSIPLGWLRIKGDRIFGLSNNHKSIGQESKIKEALGMEPLHVGILSDGICIVIDRSLWITPEKIWKVQNLLDKKVIVIREGDENGLLVALLDKEDMFLGMGLIREIDYRRKVLKIYTPVSGKFSSIVMGRYGLDENFRETMFFV